MRATQSLVIVAPLSVASSGYERGNAIVRETVIERRDKGEGFELFLRERFLEPSGDQHAAGRGS